MVKKSTKTKASSLKSGASVRKGSRRIKTEENLSNGIDTDKTEKTGDVLEMEAENASGTEEINTENEIAKSSKSLNSTQENENIEENAVTEQNAEIKAVSSDNVKKGSGSRKRKAAADGAEKPASKTKSKKQKVLHEIPTISSVAGKVFVIGDNSIGQLGFGEEISEKKRPVLLDLPYSIVDIAAGGMHSVCLTESGEVITFGCNDEGALGRVTTEEGSEFIPRKIDIPERIVQVSAGDSHSAALSDSGQVYIWGNFRNNSGPMGLITEGTNQVLPTKILKDIKIVKIASGTDHFACLSQEGIVYTCGSGDAGQLGRVSEHTSVDGGRKGKAVLITPGLVPISRASKPLTVNNIWTGSYATFLNIQQTGSIFAFGLNNHNQLGLEHETSIWKPKQVPSFDNATWTLVNGGQHHTLALDNDGLVYALGRSEYGRLGLGENCGEKSVPTLISSLEDKKCIDISCGNCESFALSDNGSVYSWGMGTNYQLGHGDDSDQHTPKLVEGNFLNSWKAFKISGGGQHTLILAHARNTSENTE